MRRHFVDTSILLYSISEDPAESRKRETAEALLERKDLALSLQVLQEVFWQITKPNRRIRMDHDDAQLFVESFLRYPVQDVTYPLMESAMLIKRRYGFSYWDSAIVAAAKSMDCRIVYTEDLQHSQVVDGIGIVNPFIKD